jgi:hypothetical protein
METDINEVSRKTYFMNPDMIRFLLVENLALKTLLHEKGLLTPEEFKVYQQQAEQILELKVQAQLEEWKKAHPEVMCLFENVSKAETKKSRSTHDLASLASISASPSQLRSEPRNPSQD